MLFKAPNLSLFALSKSNRRGSCGALIASLRQQLETVRSLSWETKTAVNRNLFLHWEINNSQPRESLKLSMDKRSWRCRYKVSLIARLLLLKQFKIMTRLKQCIVYKQVSFFVKVPSQLAVWGTKARLPLEVLWARYGRKEQTNCFASRNSPFRIASFIRSNKSSLRVPPSCGQRFKLTSFEIKPSSGSSRKLTRA